MKYLNGFLAGIIFASGLISCWCYYTFNESSSIKLGLNTYICALEVNDD